jgi:hypothetical protein
MGKNHRARMEQLRRREKIRNIAIAATTAVALGAAAILGKNILESNESKQKMPQNIARLLQETQGSREENQADLRKLRYRQVAERKIGEIQVHIAELGEVDSTNNALDYEEILNAYEHLIDYAESQPEAAPQPLVGIDEHDKIVSELDVELEISPVGKDINLFVVPSEVNIGEYGGAPVVFTEYRNAEVVSIIRPDDVQPMEGAFTEICQGTMQIKITNPETFVKEKVDKVQLVAQERLCNAVSRAMFPNFIGIEFSEYYARNIDSQHMIYTDKASGEGDLAYGGTIPVINSADIYSSLNKRIDPKLAASFDYPAIPAGQ